MLNRKSRRLASIVEVGDRQEAILANLRSYVRLATDAQRVAISFLQTVKSVDRLSVQLHDVKESVAKPLKPR